MLSKIHQQFSDLFDTRNAGFLAAAVFVAVMPLETSHLISAIIGALAYVLLRDIQPSVDHPPINKNPDHKMVAGGAAKSRNWRSTAFPGPSAPPRSKNDCGVIRRVPEPFKPQPGVKKPSAAPVAPPTFQSQGWEAEVEELLPRIMPTPENQAVVDSIALAVKHAIRPIVPEAEAAGFVTGDLSGRTAFGVAVPEVEIVVSVSMEALQKRMQNRWSQTRGNDSHVGTDARKLQKLAIRVLTDRLVGAGGFKFRRSAFRSQEPRVTFLAPVPSTVASHELGVPVSVSVNTTTALRIDALLRECERLDPRAKQLLLLIKRWVKDRGVSHAAKGHLSPYAWMMLAVYFLQVGAREEGPILPPLEGVFEVDKIAFRPCEKTEKGTPAPAVACAEKKTVAQLFQDFTLFYTEEFNWKNEMASVRIGKRCPPGIKLPLHIILHEDGVTTQVGPSIEDPFDIASNLGACMVAASMPRLHEELQRAAKICKNAAKASLRDLLEPWAPKDTEQGDMGKDGDKDGEKDADSP